MVLVLEGNFGAEWGLSISIGVEFTCNGIGVQSHNSVVVYFGGKSWSNCKN